VQPALREISNSLHSTGMIDGRTKTDVNEWIVRAALAGTSEIEMLSGVCDLLTNADVSLVRASVAMNLLDPTLGGRGVRWNRGQGMIEEAFPRTDDSQPTDDAPRAPFFVLIKSREPSLRRRLDATYRRGEFPMLDGFQEQGVTDYVAFAERVGESVRLGEGEAVVSSWTTDAPTGFSQAQIDMLAGTMPALTLAFMLRITNHAARTLITTYLGSDAAERVLAGN
jgi:adenylate cyclase